LLSLDILSFGGKVGSDTPENWILPDPVTAAENPASRRLSGKLGGPEKPATSCNGTSE
jgi:hypothetical protein